MKQNKEQEILVYADWYMLDSPQLIGRLYFAGLKLNIDEEDNSLDIVMVMKTAPYYLLSDKRAEVIKEEVTKAVSSWRKVAAKYKISPSEIERKAKAFRI